MNIQNIRFIKAIQGKDVKIAKEVNKCLKDDPHNHYQALIHIINQGFMPAEKACRLWSDALGIAWMDLNATLFQPHVVALLPKNQAKEMIAIPVYQMGDAVTVATVDPNNKTLDQQLQGIMKRKVSLVFALAEEIFDVIDVQYQSIDVIENLAEKLSINLMPQKTISKEYLEKAAGGNAIKELTSSLMLLAIQENASDIHIEPFEHHISIRFRIDGVLHERTRLEKGVLSPLISRLKIIGGIDITERRRPQDGRVTLELKNKTIGFRLSTVPTIYGEKAVLRVLGQIVAKSIPILEELILSKRNYDWTKRLINTPSGSFFITGPTGSGKTTTLFSALQSINTPDKNIMTIEDPVEYRLPGVNQVQVNSTIDLDFAKVLRSFLRQDPDVILVGEVRDLETAKIATEAALTGHLVFATLHTNDALQAVTRLVDIGVDPFLVGPSLIGVMAQRLARKLCPECKEPYTLSTEEMDNLFEWSGLSPLQLYRHKGCSSCKFTGYSGRLAIHEMLMVSEELRKRVSANAPIEELRETAVKSGYQTMRYDGIKKVIRGLTTLSEIDRIAPWAYDAPV